MASPLMLHNLIAIGAFADRPTAGVNGRLYLATDGTVPISRDNGTTWEVPVASSIATEDIQDAVGAMVQAGTGITVTYSDVAGTLTIDNTATLSTEGVQDIIGAMASGSSGVTVTYNDPAGTLVISFNYAAAAFIAGVEAVVEAMDLAANALPAGGGTNQVLMKASGADHDVAWNDFPENWYVPVGGTTGQLLAKDSNDDRDVEWVDPPTGDAPAMADITDLDVDPTPSTGQLLAKAASGYAFVDRPTLATLSDVDVDPAPTTGQLLAKKSGAGFEFVDPPEGTGGGDGNPFTLMFTANGNVMPLGNGLLMTRGVV